MRVCQFRHFGTGTVGAQSPTGSISESRKRRAACQIAAKRTRPMLCLVNLKSADRIIYSIAQRFNLIRKTRTLGVFAQAA